MDCDLGQCRFYRMSVSSGTVLLLVVIATCLNCINAEERRQFQGTHSLTHLLTDTGRSHLEAVPRKMLYLPPTDKSQEARWLMCFSLVRVWHSADDRGAALLCPCERSKCICLAC